MRFVARRAPAYAVLLCFSALAQAPKSEGEAPKAASNSETVNRRTELNLLGKTDTESGEARRNENVQFNLIDNNALKELNMRVGTTATLFDEFRGDKGYFGTEFGNKPVSTIHLTAAKSSPWHGNVFWQGGNSVFNARSFFQVGPLKPAQDNQYGIGATVRLWKGAFLSMDGSRQHLRGFVNGNVLVPRANERTPLTTDPAKRAVIQRFLNAFPDELPNRTDINPRALNTNARQGIDDDSGSLRLEQTLPRKNLLSFRYAYTAQYVDAFQLVAGQNPDTTTRAHTAMMTWTHTFSARTIAQGSAGFDRVGSLLVPEPNAVGPQVNFSNVLATLGPGSSIPINRAQNRFRYGGSITQNRGAHNWYLGAELARRQLNGYEASSQRGNLYFRNDFGRDAITNLLLGEPSRFSGAVGNIHRGFRSWEPVTYAGDSWHVLPALTISYGLRYELVSRPVEVNDLNRIPYDSDRNNFAPRFGLAWRAPGRLGVVRAAYGLHYGEIFPVTYSQVRYNLPLNQKFEIQAPNLLTVYPAVVVPSGASDRATYIDIDPELVTPYSHQYNFVWEPRFAGKWRVQLGYAGSRSHKLLMMWYTNRAIPTPGIPQTTATINDRRPDLRYYDHRRIVNASRGYFDAARVTVIMPRWHGITMESSYWLSKAIDLGGSYTNTGIGDDGRQALAQTEFMVAQDLRGPSIFDQRHALLTRASWSTPRLPLKTGRFSRWIGRWELAGVVLLKTGTPFTVLSGSDAPGFGNVDGDSGDRVNLIDRSVLGRAINHPDTSKAALPASAFAFIGPFDARGNLGSNTFRKDGISNVNASVARTFAVGGDRKLLLRAESVNMFNTPQFAEPWRELSSPSFGAITNTLNDGRAFRCLLRFSF
ncbi:MAG: TonB-dependent receptor [Bryobacterales bacterium]|nr:TonB-dependent receptor [Bryobacterales bacterium]